MNIRKIIIGMTAAALCAISLTACGGTGTGSGSGSGTNPPADSSDSSASEIKTDNTAADGGGSSASEIKTDNTAADMVKNAPASGGNVYDVTIQTGDIVAEFDIEGFGKIKAKLFPDIAPVGVQNFVQLAQDGYYDGKNIHRVISDFMFQGGSENGDGTGGNAAYSGEGSDADSFGIEVGCSAWHFYGALCYANAGGRNTTQFYIVNNKKPQDIGEITPEDVQELIDTAKTEKEKYEEGSYEYGYFEKLEKEFGKLADTADDVIAKYKNGGTPSLDGGYTVFGQVVEGFDVVDNISAVKVQDNGYGEESKPVDDIIIKSVKVYTAE